MLTRLTDAGYVLVERFDALDKLDDSATWKGMILRRKQSNVVL